MPASDTSSTASFYTLTFPALPSNIRLSHTLTCSCIPHERGCQLSSRTWAFYTRRVFLQMDPRVRTPQHTSADCFT